MYHNYSSLSIVKNWIGCRQVLRGAGTTRETMAEWMNGLGWGIMAE